MTVAHQSLISRTQLKIHGDRFWRNDPALGKCADTGHDGHHPAYPVEGHGRERYLLTLSSSQFDPDRRLRSALVPALKAMRSLS